MIIVSLVLGFLFRNIETSISFFSHPGVKRPKIIEMIEVAIKRILFNFYFKEIDSVLIYTDSFGERETLRIDEKQTFEIKCDIFNVNTNCTFSFFASINIVEKPLWVNHE